MMSDAINQMIRRLFDRQATADDVMRINRLTAHLPAELLASPAAVAEIVLRNEHLLQLEVIVQKAGWEGQQRIHHDLDERVDRAAMAALTKLRDTLPIDGHDRTARLIKAVAIWTIIVLAVATVGGWEARSWSAGREQTRHHAAFEEAFNRCADAAAGLATANHPSAGPIRFDTEVYREQARLCAADYADRLAGG